MTVIAFALLTPPVTLLPLTEMPTTCCAPLTLIALVLEMPPAEMMLLATKLMPIAVASFPPATVIVPLLTTPRPIVLLAAMRMPVFELGVVKPGVIVPALVTVPVTVEVFSITIEVVALPAGLVTFATV